MTEQLINRYRPRTLDEVIGQPGAVTSLRSIFERNDTHGFLFSGPGGTGKTTLARITAAAMRCAEKDITEVPAAVYTGVDDMRDIITSLQYRPFGGSVGKAIILDEAHRLSKNAWDSLLKIVEEPPDFVYWMLCTTQESKIPATIKQRCAKILLKEVGRDDLALIVENVCAAEQISIPDGVFDLVVREAHGSPRQALSNLSIVRDMHDRNDAARALQTVVLGEATVELCRYLVQGRGSWQQAMSLVERLNGESPEGIRRIVNNYVAKALMGARSNDQAVHYVAVLDAFRTPYPDEDVSHLLVSIGRVMLFAPPT